MQKDTARYATTKKIVECLSSGDNVVTTDNTLNYIAASSSLQQQQLAGNKDLSTWVDAVKAAKARTGDDLGVKYPVISEQLWTAVQKASPVPRRRRTHCRQPSRPSTRSSRSKSTPPAPPRKRKSTRP